MTETRGGAIEAHVGERLSGYLDGELTQQDRQWVELQFPRTLTGWAALAAWSRC